jgi:DNA-binding NtrC family response regulator
MAKPFKQTIRKRPPPPRKAIERRLIVVYSPDPPAIGRTFSLDGTLTLGRERDGAEGFDDPSMSREHLRVAVENDEVVVEDLDTANGTFVSGEKLTGKRTLEANDVLSIGDTLLVLDRAPEPTALPIGKEIATPALPSLLGISLTADVLRRSLATVAKAGGSVLLLGPTGAGKEVAARAIHDLSGRSGPWVPVNCAAIPKEIAEAELFGHEKGAYTGATHSREGYFAQSSGGTLFLDEIGELPEPLQAKLLRVLEDKMVTPLGGGEPRKIELAIVAATNRDVDSTSFRADLKARLGDWILRMPALADRRADILHLFDRFLREKQASRAPMQFTPELAEALLLHDWPLNVRELIKLARRLAVLEGTDADLDLHLLDPELQDRVRARFEEPAEKISPTAPPLEELEAALAEADGNVKLAAMNRGWHRTQIYRWLRQYRLDVTKYRR